MTRRVLVLGSLGSAGSLLATALKKAGAVLVEPGPRDVEVKQFCGRDILYAPVNMPDWQKPHVQGGKFKPSGPKDSGVARARRAAKKARNRK